MQEIQNNGETDPEIWKDCQVRSTKNENVIMENSSKRAIHRDDFGGEAEVSRCVTGGLVCYVLGSWHPQV